MQLECRVAIAGWSIRKEQKDWFAAEGSHLQRYASRFDAVEINSSFYGSHKRETYERWAARVPASFTFAVKAPKWLTHESGLEDTGDALKRFLHEIGGLGANGRCGACSTTPRGARPPRTRCTCGRG